MIKLRRKIRPTFMYVALFLVMFGVGFVVAKTTETTTSALDQQRLLEFSQNNILFYNPDSSNDCVSTVHFAGNELTWEDLNPLSFGDRLKLIVQTYGEFAMDLQRWYGVPWEMPFGVMIFESSVGEDVPYSPSNKAKEVGMFEMMGLVDDSWLNKDFSNGNATFRDPYASTVEQTPSVCSENTGSCAPGAPEPTQTHVYKNYETISNMMLGYVLHHVSSNHGVATTVNGVTYDSPYEAGLHMLEPQSYAVNLNDAVDLMMRPYCTREDGRSCYSDKLYALITNSSNNPYPQVHEVAVANGWKNSIELAESENLPAGGYWRQEHGWGDIRSAVWNTYGEAGLPSNEATRYGAATTTMTNGSVSAEVGGGSVLHSPTHEWLDSAGLEGFIKNEISLTGTSDRAIDYNVVENGQYLNYAADAGNGSGLPGFIVLHLSSASNFGARSWTNFTSETPDGRPIYVPPHFTIDVKNREIFQHFPLSHPSAAVAVRYDTPDGTPFISDRYGIQIEIVGHGGTPDKTCIPASCDADHLYTNFTNEDWEYVAKLLVAISNETGIPLVSSVSWVSDYNQAPSVKMPTEDLKSYIGVLGHEHINGKWDPLDTWDYIKPALERIGYSYTSSVSSSFTTCGTPSLRGSCMVFDDVYDGGCTEDGYSFYWQSGKAWKDYPIRTCGDGNPTIGGGGCGYAALANIVTNLTGNKVTPIDIVNVAKSASSTAFYSCGEGSDGGMPKGVLDANSYGLSYEYFQNNDNFTVEYINAVLDRGGGGKNMILFTLGSGPLAYAGHWVVIRGKTPDGKWKMFTTSTWYEGQYEVYDVNDKLFDPNVIVNAHVAWRSYWYVISKQ